MTTTATTSFVLDSLFSELIEAIADSELVNSYSSLVRYARYLAHENSVDFSDVEALLPSVLEHYSSWVSENIGRVYSYDEYQHFASQASLIAHLGFSEQLAELEEEYES